MYILFVIYSIILLFEETEIENLVLQLHVVTKGIETPIIFSYELCPNQCFGYTQAFFKYHVNSGYKYAEFNFVCILIFSHNYANIQG